MTALFTRRDNMWRAIRKLRRFTASELSRRAMVPAPTVKGYVTCLRLAGILRMEPGRPYTYALVRDPGPETPIRTPAGAESAKYQLIRQAWQAMRVLRSWSVAELALCLPDFDSGHRSIERYCTLLAQVGVLRADMEHARWSLVRDLGPCAPRIQDYRPGDGRRLRRVVDPNSRQVIARPTPSRTP